MTQKNAIPSIGPDGAPGAHAAVGCPLIGGTLATRRRRESRPGGGWAQGFTLLELLIGMVVLGILMSIGVSSMARWRQSLDADNFLAGLASDFNVSRTRTQATGQERRIRLVDASTYIVENRATPTAAWSAVRTATFPKPMFDMGATVARRYDFNTKGYVNTYNQSGQLTTSTDIRVLAGSGLKTLSVSALGIARRM
ncbi:pilus assembly FimT family protein [Deinococcus koreensis]|uniref:Prepilin-type N-terminal cleavage/methylation domain-containing protein n=1 Tax=Deinococcus koreensis TaxID=2054903 RepID=A0A2K3UYL0_9DEIO|nr:prepilin-type N-terminal cleavage/methylation domain-containing protein [Deinococcus koreensis]PNY81618.1 hypothetical protein CVO96_09740 [Deinococcus koreensis]